MKQGIGAAIAKPGLLRQGHPIGGPIPALIEIGEVILGVGLGGLPMHKRKLLGPNPQDPCSGFLDFFADEEGAKPSQGDLAFASGGLKGVLAQIQGPCLREKRAWSH